MDRWQRTHGHVGVGAPSWLTFEVHRPYFDGAATPLTAIQARGPVLAARLFARREPTAPRFGMVMPASFRQLLVEESRLREYDVRRPSDLDARLASPDWLTMAAAYRGWDDLDDTDRVGLAFWLLAACLPGALLEVLPHDRAAEDSREPLAALLQYSRAKALAYSEGLSAATGAAHAVLIDDPRPTLGHQLACSGWAYLLSRHASDDAAAEAQLAEARRIHEELAPAAEPFDQAVRTARLALSEIPFAERRGDLDRAWGLVARAQHFADKAAPVGPEQEAVALEVSRRIIDRRVEIAVKRADWPAEEQAIDEGLKLDPYCVKIRMQAAQSAERRGDLAAAMTGYLVASRLGPFGTAFGLLRAASCAGRLGHDELARVLCERAHRAAPRSGRTREALVAACEATGDHALAEVVREPGSDYRANWHYRMYGAYFNLGPALSPCMYAAIPTHAYEFAVQGEQSRIDLQRIMPPAFRSNLVRESGLRDFAVSHPGELPEELRTPEWQQLCDWVASYSTDDLARQRLTCHVLFRLGFRRLVLDLIEERPADSLREPGEFHLQRLRDFAQYADSVGGRTPTEPRVVFETLDNPRCPLILRYSGSVFAVVYAARVSKSIEDAVRGRARAQEYLDDILASDDFSEFEKTMLHSRFYRGVGFVPFMQGDAGGTVDDMARAEELARALHPATPWEELLARENLHACLESRSKEAFGLGQTQLGHARTEEFLALDPYDPKSHIELAESLSKQERYAEAAASYLRAARLGPLGTALAYNMAGEAFDRAGQPALAEDCFAQALRFDPHAVSAARGWRRVAASGMSGLATEYADQLEAWGAARSAAS